jgi:anti-anti-sigma factor
MTDVRAHPLQVEVDDDAGDGAVVRVTGVLDHHTADRFSAATDGLAGRPAVQVDLAAVEWLDSSGLAALLRLHRLVADAGGGVRVVEPSPAVRRMLETTQLDRLFLADAP